MTLTLTQEQLAILGTASSESAVPVVDPLHHRSYVLVPADVYQKLVGVAAAVSQPLYELMDEVAGPEGWDDPEMDVYDQLDPRICRC